MANTPTYANWKQATSGLINPGNGLTVWPGQTVPERILAAFAALASGQNPDGTARGT